MNYKPLSDSDIESINLIPEDSQCYAEVLEASNHISKDKGNESIKLVLGIWEDVSMRCKIFVYLTPNFPKLFKHAVVSMIGIDKYNSGDISCDDFINKTCDVIIGIENGKGEYEGKKKNIIKDFLPTKYNKKHEKDNDMPF